MLRFCCNSPIDNSFKTTALHLTNRNKIPPHMWACSFKSLVAFCVTRLPPVTGIILLCSKMDQRCTSLPCTEPEFSALLFTFDPPASKAVPTVLFKEWKEAVTNWKSRELKNQDHRSSFLVSFLCKAGRTIRTDVCTPVHSCQVGKKGL